MPRTIQAVYENGVLKPLHKLDLPDRETVELLILEDDLPPSLLAQVAHKGGSYNFLSRSGEDLYTAEDGERLD
ncbi:MAG: antitoxin family protein [Dehalococcoidales bacterium]|nr:antitoxin family protein [Dehalococcoidales bacterium]